jgi:2-C-methyl-D-erythritol 2,4-cyclodiphosphate synthase
MIGGVEIPYELGLAGHSDADVLIHALMDALLGAAGEGDIGVQFPDSDPAYKDISSMVLLEKVVAMVKKKRFKVINVDCVIVAQEPRLSPYMDEMRGRLASSLEIKEDRVSVKATTTEGMGFTGRGEGIAAMVNVMLQLW